MIGDRKERRFNLLVVGVIVVLLAAAIIIALVVAGVFNDDTDDADQNEDNSAVYQDLKMVEQGSFYDPPVELADFSLPSTTGEDFRLSDHQGNVVLLYFGYMSCPDFCPTTMVDLKRAEAQIGDLADRVDVVMVTVDPERDEMDRLTRYVQGFDPSFIGLRGEGEALQSVMNQFFVVANQRELENSALGYTVDHTVHVMVVDPQGRWIGRFPYGMPVDEIAHDLQLILEANR